MLCPVVSLKHLIKYTRKIRLKAAHNKSDQWRLPRLLSAKVREIVRGNMDKHVMCPLFDIMA